MRIERSRTGVSRRGAASRAGLALALAGLLAAASASAGVTVPSHSARPEPSAAKLPWTPSSAAGLRPLEFSKSTLPNGMTVILHESHDVPIVVVNVSFDVGSRHEAPGRTGFAHLFEHLMFMGTRRVPTKAFDEWMESAGGWNNAWTSQDRTNYYDVGPSSSLDLLLWMEADRLRDLGPLMTLEKLNAQRDVVRNERRQTSENTPYGKVELRLPELLYPKGHPYHHPVIGSHEDLEAATVDDVKAFFAKYYDPANATIVVAGDFDPTHVKARIEQWFGPIPSRGAPSDPGAPGFDDTKTTLTSVVRETIEDDVELDKVVMAWQTPKHFAPGDAELDLLATALADGKASRLYKSLVYEQKLAQSVEAAQESGVLGSRFVIGVVARPGVSLDKLEAAIDKELEAVRKKPLAEDELVRAKNLVETAFVTQLESVRHRAALLAMYQSERKDPGWAPKDLERYRAATKEAVRDVAAKYLPSDARVVLRVVRKAASNEAGATKGGSK